MKQGFSIIGLVIGLSVFALLSACSEDESKLDNMQLIQFYIEQGNDLQALQLLGKEIERGRNLLDANRITGELMVKSGFYQDSIQPLEAAIAEGCQLECYRSLIDALLELGQVDRAEHLFMRNISDKSTAAARYQLAMIAMLRDHSLEDGLLRFADIDYPRARDKSMMLRLQLGRLEQVAAEYSAEQAYTQLELLGFSHAFYRLNRYEEAEDALLLMRQMQTGNLLTQLKIQAVEALVRVKVAQGNFRSARALYDTFMASNKDSVYAKYHAAIENLGKQNFDQVISEMGSLYSRNPDSIEILRLVALAEFGKKNYQGVVEHLAILGEQLDSISRVLLAASLNRLSRPHEVIALYREAKIDSRAALELARAHAILGNKEKAWELTRNTELAVAPSEFNFDLLQLWLQIERYDAVIEAVSALESEQPRFHLLAVESFLRLDREADARAYADRIGFPSVRLQAMAFLETQIGNSQAAISHYRKSLDVDQPKISTYERLAALNIGLAQYDQALKAIQTGANISGSNDGLIRLAGEIIGQVEHLPTKEWLQGIPKGRLDYSLAQLQLARAELARGQRQTAVDRLRRLAYENDREATFLLAKTLANSDPEEALRLAEELLAGEYSLQVAVFLLSRYQKAGAEENLRQIVQLVIGNSGVNVRSARLLGDAYLALKDTVALERLAEEIDRQGFGAVAMDLRGDAQLARGDLVAARSNYLDSVAARMTESVFVKYLKVSLVTRPGDIDRLLARAESVLELNPSYSVLRRLVGTKMIGRNNSTAEMHLKVLLDSYPTDPMLLNNLAWINLNNRPRLALDYSKQAHELLPSSLEILDTYVRALVKNDRKAAARALLSEQIKRYPEQEQLSELLDWIG